jgi:hypothetical protein
MSESFLAVVDEDPGLFRLWFWAEIVGGWTYAPGMIYLGRAGPSKMIELTPFSLSLIGAEVGGEEDGDGEGMNAAGRIGPSKMSTHSLIFSVPGEPGVGVGAVLISGEGGGGGMVVVEVMGSIWACLEMEDE